MLRNKVYACINIGGLAISLAVFILMALYIENELSFDRFHVNAGRIYRVADDKQTPDILLRSASSAAPVAPALQQDFPQIEQAVRLTGTESLVKYEGKMFEERRIFYSDPSFFQVFSFPLRTGNASTVLRDPQNVVLTASTARKYFGNDDPVNKVLLFDGRSMKVTGVMDDVPANSHLQFDILVSMSTAQQKGSGYDWLFNNWYSNEFYTYILLPEQYQMSKLTGRLIDFDARHRQAGSTTTHRYVLEKLSDIYLQSARDNQAGKSGNMRNLYIFSAVAFFILLIASINFVNLSTARAAVRAREVAVKRVVGAGRWQMIAQFLTESFLMAGISLLISLLLSVALLPAFNRFSGKVLALDLLSPVHMLTLIMLLLCIGLLSGCYPAFILSRFRPAATLKGNIPVSPYSLNIRKGLVVFQFAVSVMLIICTTVVYTQMDFLQKHDLGFTPEQTLVINFEGDQHVKDRLTLIKEQMLTIPGVRRVSASSNVPGDGRAGGWSMDFLKEKGDTVHTELPVYLADFNFMQQYHIPVVAGRPLSSLYAADSTESMLINETALKKLGFSSPAQAIGVHVVMYPTNGVITGVFRDFHFESLQKQVEPLAIRMLPSNFRLLSAEINTRETGRTIAGIEKLWHDLVPGRPLEYNFLNESFNRQYESETRFGKVFTACTLLAVVVACLGLFGLALFSVQQRTKEIGIRKVLGAGVAGIATLVSKDFIALVLVAVVVASPVAGWLMHHWLQDFAYRISMQWWMFALAGFAAVLVALFTVGFQAIKAALANPVNSLRND